jgi:hypothetical protein
MPTRLWAVRNALAAITITSGASVHNGPLPPKSTPPKQFLLIGSDGGADGFGGELGDDATSIEQSESELGNNWRNEEGDIVCAAWVWSGGTDLVPLRAAASAITDEVEAFLIADRSLGGVLTPPGLARFTGLRFQETQTSKGAVVRALFTVSYRALLT